MTLETGLIAVVSAESVAIVALFGMLRSSYGKLEARNARLEKRISECEEDRKALNKRLTDVLQAFAEHHLKKP